MTTILTDMNESIIIVGAGAAGLMAGKELAPHFDVSILEAADRIGGRMDSIVSGENIIEAGAEFIHGNLPVTLKLLKKAGITYLPVEGEMYRKKHNGLVIEKEMFPGWDELMKKMKKLKEDMPLDQFLEVHFPGETNTLLRNRAKKYAEGFDLVDTAKAGVRSLYKEWSAESGDTYRIPAGYKSLASYLEKQATGKGCKILLNKKVHLIKWKENSVVVYTDKQEEFHANKILITVPVSILQKNDGSGIEFEPPINKYTEAAKNIGFGTVIKVVLKFKTIFWKADAGFILSDEKYFPTWWTKPPGITPLLTGWMGGTVASEISNQSDTAIMQKALASLSSIFSIPLEQLAEKLIYSKVFNWSKHEHALGGYSYDMIDSDAAKKTLNGPLLNTVFFAGEALYSGKYPGTVEAALVNAKESSKKIKRSG